MLKNISKDLSPELVKTLMEMGHGDEIVIADGNFPAASHAKNLIRCDGLSASQLLTSILKFLPLDTYTEYAVTLMAIVDGDDVKPTIWKDYQDIIRSSNTENQSINYIDRFEFYDRSKKAYAIIATGEEALYANLLLRKGVVI